MGFHNRLIYNCHRKIERDKLERDIEREWEGKRGRKREINIYRERDRARKICWKQQILVASRKSLENVHTFLQKNIWKIYE